MSLTDLKLKSELSILVDINLWENCILELKLLEKTLNADILALEVEFKLSASRRNDLIVALQRSQEAVDKIRNEIESISKEISQLSISSVEFAESSMLSDLETKIRNIEDCELPSLRKKLLEIVRNRSASLQSEQSELSCLKASVLTNETELTSLTNQKCRIENKIQSLEQQRESILIHAKQLVNEQLQQLEVDQVLTKLAEYEKMYREKSHRLSQIQIQIQMLNSSLRGIQINATYLSTTEKCPSCGQILPKKQREEREKHLIDERLKLQYAEKEAVLETTSLLRVIDSLKKALDYCQTSSLLTSQIKDLKHELMEIFRNETGVRGKLDDLKQALQIANELKTQSINQTSSAEKDLQLKIDLHEQQLTYLKTEYRNLQTQKEKERSCQSVKTEEISQLMTILSGLQGKLSSMLEFHESIRENALELDSQLNTSQVTSQEFRHRLLICNKLIELFGAKGIQHYVFMGIVEQIETVANCFLDILADGGIQLNLKESSDVEKICKYVTIRTATGEYKERALSQLSGGQWRRVSLALDLAFVEIVRQRGYLRSNILVADEILTHLDAAGREAVGQLLKAMVGSSGYREDIEAKLSGIVSRAYPYNTILIILQDLAATEMEESFDCVDVVKRDGDTSRVMVDGL